MLWPHPVVANSTMSGWKNFADFCKKTMQCAFSTTFWRKFQIMQNYNFLPFCSSRMALATFYYRGLISQHIIYHDDYTIWELMCSSWMIKFYLCWIFPADVGGVLGLYFGLTIVTLYELIVFFTLVERETAESSRPLPEQLFTRRFLYRRDATMLTDQPVPRIF